MTIDQIIAIENLHAANVTQEEIDMLLARPHTPRGEDRRKGRPEGILSFRNGWKMRGKDRRAS